MLQKRLDFGSNGYHVPFVPRAARSARKRGPVQKKVTDNQLCAFDLLATIAGKILLEGETSCQSPPTTDLINSQDIVMDGDNRGNGSLVVEHCDRGSTEVASPPLTLELGIRGLGVDLNEKDFQTPSHDASLAPTKIDLNRDGTDSHSVEDPEILDGISPTLVCSDGSVKLTLGNDPYPCKGDNVAVVSRDDDENSSECIQPSTIKAARSPPTRVGDRRIRKLLESKHRRIFSKSRDGDLTDADVRCLYRNRRIGYKRQRSQRIYPFKRRRFYHHNSLSSSHADMSYKSLYSYPDKAFDSKSSGFSSLGVNGSSACVAGQSTTFSSRESHVKLRIKSFRVPELFIEMPETASIGSLKRTVMEAVTALLGGGLRVGVFLQGKKVRDDNRTLVQSGICHNNKAESLGFSLEPNPSPAVTTPVYSEENSLVLPTDVLPQPVPQSPIITSIQQGLSTSLLSADHPAANNLSNLVESDYDSAPSPVADVSGEKAAVDSHALVSLPSGTPQALAVVHSNQKSKRHDMGQRRIRRPFSVSEVEALVHAVEKLGTGRWRDVKIRAFENVKHRTYVDLKDKWKTLVHTASIAPQQRRGEPVPQELLDRVLAAHAYWTEQQSKQQQLPKQPPPSETHLVLCEHS